jgi:uncharacterized protein YndB with AHSA1/START domain
MPNICHRLLIEASPETVYHAITSEEGLSAWWTPNAKVKPEIDSVARFPFGTDYFKEMRITELEAFKWIKWNCIKADAEWVGTKLSFKLEGGDSKTLLSSYPEMLGQLQQLSGEKATLLIFQHEDWREYTPMFAECSYTWAQFLRSLKLLRETGKGRPGQFNIE